jgi:hypothetical protein
LLLLLLLLLQMINRTFFTLISISLVAAAARHAYDQLGNFCPRRLKCVLQCHHQRLMQTRLPATSHGCQHV